MVSPLEQGSPTPWPRTGISPRPVRNRAAEQEVSGGQASKASSLPPRRLHYGLDHPALSVEKLSSMKRVPGAKMLGTAALEGTEHFHS